MMEDPGFAFVVLQVFAVIFLVVIALGVLAFILKCIKKKLFIAFAVMFLVVGCGTTLMDPNNLPPGYMEGQRHLADRIAQDTGEGVQDVLTGMLPGAIKNALDSIKFDVPGKPVVNVETGEPLIDSKGNIVFTPERTGILGALGTILGLWVRGRGKDKRLEGKTDHERSRRKEVEERLANLEKEREIEKAVLRSNGNKVSPYLTTS